MSSSSPDTWSPTTVYSYTMVSHVANNFPIHILSFLTPLNPTLTRSLPRASRSRRMCPVVLVFLEFLVQDPSKNIVSELRVLQTQLSELFLRLTPKHMRSRSPEIRHGGSDRLVVFLRVRIHVSGVRNFALGRRVDAVDLGRREGF